MPEQTPAPATPATPAAPAAPAPEALMTLADFQRFKFRIAQVLEARVHPNANKLLVLKVDAGQGPRQIVAGLRAHYEPESLVGRKIVMLDNLEPATLRGERSEGMLLAATDPGTGAVRILAVDGDVPVGSTVR